MLARFAHLIAWPASLILFVLPVTLGIICLGDYAQHAHLIAWLAIKMAFAWIVLKDHILMVEELALCVLVHAQLVHP